MGSELWTRAPHLAVIAEHVGFSLAKFEVGQEGKTAYGRLMGTSAKRWGNDIRGRNLVEEKPCQRSARRAHGNVRVLGRHGDHGRVPVGDQRGIWQSEAVTIVPVGIAVANTSWDEKSCYWRCCEM